MDVVETRLKVTILTDPAIFASRVHPVIRHDPVVCSVLATNLDAALRGAAAPDARWVLVETADPHDHADPHDPADPHGHANPRDPTDPHDHADVTDGDVVLAGMIIPPFPLWLTPVYGAPADLVTDHLARALVAATATATTGTGTSTGSTTGPPHPAGATLTGVCGVHDSATPFARAWHRVTGRAHETRMAQRMFELTELVEPSGVPGCGRLADPTDRDLCIDWLHAFHAEALPHEVVGDVVRIVDRRIAHGGFCLWDDEARPVSLAGVSTVVAGVARIGPVYTPPHRRGRGYGAAVTAVATRAGFAAGATRCMLFTDLTNPTSNALYPRLGYRPVCDAVDYAFID